MDDHTRPISLAIVHPLRMWVQALGTVIAPIDDVHVVVAHTDPGRARQAVLQGRVDVVLLALTPEQGAGPVADMREANPDVGVCIMSDSEDREFISEVVRAGARGYLPQNIGLGGLLQAVRAIPRGETWMHPRHVSMLVDGMLESESARLEEQNRLSPLSAREREVLQYLALGMRRQDIADRLDLSVNTVRTHINHLLLKLEVHSTIAAVSVFRHAPGQQKYGDDGLVSGSL